jgi:hypothetical protein
MTIQALSIWMKKYFNLFLKYIHHQCYLFTIQILVKYMIIDRYGLKMNIVQISMGSTIELKYMKAHVVHYRLLIIN